MPRERLAAESKEATNHFVELARPYQPRAIILFGSYARGDFTESSDIDLCLIADKLPEDELARRTAVDMPRIRKVRTIGFFPEEFIEYLRDMRFLAFDIVAEGTVIYDDGVYQKIRETYDEVIKRHGIRKLKHGWMVSNP